ncbi:unnamed protein product [Sphagnum balticum]
MEEAKREKEERKVINQERGKNVDIDFEIMIEKNKFREKMLSPHISSADLKVTHPNPARSVRAQAAHLQEGGAEWINRLDLLRQPPDKDPRTEVQSGWYHQIRRKSRLHLRQHL